MHEAAITHEAIYDLTDFGIYMPEGEQLAALASFIDKNKARLDSISYRWNRLDQLVFTPDRTKLIAWCDSKPNGSIKMLSVKDGSLQKELPLKGEKEFVWALNLNKDGTKLAYVSVYPEGKVDSVICYSLKEERPLWKRKLSDKGNAAFALNFSANTGDLIVINYEGVHTYNSESGNERSVQKEIFDGFVNMDARLNQNYAGISPSGKYAAAWQTAVFKGYGGRFSGVTDFAYERDARYNKLRIWDLENNKEVNEINAPESGITENIYFTPDEEKCVFKTSNNKIYQLPLNGRKTSALWNDTTFINKVYPVYMSFSPSGRHVAVVNELMAQVWDLDKEVIVKDFNRVQKKRKDTYKKSYPLAFSPDEKYFAMEYYGELRLYDINTFEPVWSVYSWPEDKERIWTDIVDK
ncbi:MAG TPA: WD40 repeat domain-containing protein [Ignavibacteriales bacterium]|nr:WD40 repeat domain-containing protein [Ignavibacteriales bacterium]